MCAVPAWLWAAHPKMGFFWASVAVSLLLFAECPRTWHFWHFWACAPPLPLCLEVPAQAVSPQGGVAVTFSVVGPQRRRRISRSTSEAQAVTAAGDPSRHWA